MKRTCPSRCVLWPMVAIARSMRSSPSKRDTGCGIDPGEGALDAQLAGDGARDIDVVSAPGLALARAEQRIVLAHADTDLPLAEDTDETVDAGLGAGARHGGLGAGILDQLRERGVG